MLAVLILAALAGCATTSTTSTRQQTPLVAKPADSHPHGMLFGINSNSSGGHSATWVAGNVVGDRSNDLDVLYSDSPAAASEAVGKSLADGCQPVVIIDVEDSSLLSNVSPSGYAAGAKALVQRVVADHPTVRTFELINEPYFKGPQKKSNAADYANILAKTYEEVATLGLKDVRLLVAGWGSYEVVDGSGEGTGKVSDPEQGGGWIHDLAAAQPALRQAVNGWTTHPYGSPEGPSEHHEYGMTSTEDQRNDAGLVGFNLAGRNDWWITEVGFEAGGSGPNSSTSEDMQAEKTLVVLKRALTWHKEGWLQGLFIYDDGSSGYNIYGRKAQAVFTRFASEHAE
jgi:hypothetical protein